MLRPILALALFAAGAARAWESGLPPAAPVEVGMSSRLLDAGVELFRDAVSEGDIRGAVLLVARKGKAVVHQPVGWRDHEAGLPMERDTLFRAASNTKPVVATAVLMLAEEGKLSLDDEVRKHLASFDNPRAGSIRIRHLLSHTSGMRIPTIFLQPLLQPPSLRAEVDRFGAVGAEEPPETGFSYNNPGFNTLGALIEAVSGVPLDVFLRERIYRPLGMNDSYNHESAAPNGRMGKVYRHQEGEHWKPSWSPGQPSEYPFVRASGGMITSVADYARFCQMFVYGGELDGVRLLRPESVAAATRPQPGSDAGARPGMVGYGFGWFLYADGRYGHGGSDGTWASIDPARETIVLVFTQSPGGRIPREQFARVAAAAIAVE